MILDKYTKLCLLFLVKSRKRPVTLPPWMLIAIEEELEPEGWVRREGTGWGLTTEGEQYLARNEKRL